MHCPGWWRRKEDCGLMAHEIGPRQRWAWLAGGLSAAVAACACGIGWVWVLAGGLAGCAYYLYIDRKLPDCGLAPLLSAPGAVLSWLWTAAALAWAANLADRAFPMVDGDPLLGWVMLALAAWGSWKGAGSCARCAGVLCLFLMVLYGIIAVFAVPDIQWENLRPTGSWMDGAWVLGLFLLPAAVWYGPVPRRAGKPVWGMALLLPLAAAALSAVTAGVLSPRLAASLPVPLYTLAESVSLFGVIKRMEPLLSAAITMGVFCLLSAMASGCRILAERFRLGRWGGAAACVLAAALMGPAREIGLPEITVGGVILWGILPLLALYRTGRRKANKHL